MAFKRSDEGKTSTLVCEGKTLADVFISAAHGLFDVLAGSSKIRGDKRQEIVVQAENTVPLFTAWLTELRSRVTDMGMLYSDFEIFSIQKAGPKQYVLTGALYGEPIDNERHSIISGVTLDEKSVTCDEKAGRAVCSFALSRS